MRRLCIAKTEDLVRVMMNQTDVLTLATNSKKLNLMRITHFLRSHDNVTISEIAESTKIPTQTVYRIVRSLRASGLVTQTASRESVSGRKAVLYSINPQSRLLLGAYMDKTMMHIFVSDLAGTVLSNHSYTYDDDKTREEILEMIDSGILRGLSDLGMDGDGINKIAVMGFAVVANIDKKERKIIAFNNLQCMDGFPLVRYMEQKYGVKTVLLKNSYIESYASLIQLSKKGIDNFVEVHIGLGIGAAVIINGSHYLGAFGNVGELVHLYCNGDEPIEARYNTGNLYKRYTEYVKASKNSALEKKIRQQMELTPNNTEQALMRAVDDEVGNGNPYVVEMVNELVPGWAEIIRNLIIYYDPQAIVVNGDLSEETPHIFDLLKKNVRRILKTKTQVVPASQHDTWEMSIVASVIDNAYEVIFKSTH